MMQPLFPAYRSPPFNQRVSGDDQKHFCHRQSASRLFPVSGPEKGKGRFQDVPCKTFRFVASLVLPSLILHAVVYSAGVQDFYF
ncbi:hypothetical protein [Pantoea ananatis]|uniref:hypothetical protein n=1 Tax=Pantoea ananas TaxID=553 RepID=UPI0021E72A23|nr:hypothetical protein [Pantoea ananatis]MCV3300848.1 hypothetical protein [Pantoea ananatis]